MPVHRFEHPAPSIFSASALWTVIGLFGLLFGLVLLVFGGAVFSAVEGLAGASISGPNPLSQETAGQIRDGIRSWGWAGIVASVVTLPLGVTAFRTRLVRAIGPTALRSRDDLLPPDGHGLRFFLTLGGVLVFAVVAHWSLRTYTEVGWLESEDGLSEWWSVATSLAGAAAIGAAAWTLRSTRLSPLRYFYLALASGLFLGAMEEISWGQRLTGWGTPAVLQEVNVQNETNLHNVNFIDSVVFEGLFWGSLLGLIGGFWRFTANRRGLSDLMRLVLPSITLAPALLLIMVWRTGDIWRTANIPRLVMDHFDSGPRGSEVPEALLGLCIVLYTFNNLRQAREVRRWSKFMASLPADQNLPKETP
ncbi:MAG: hypothetical protein O3A93_13020 [Chloroflexi bacterium]|nr:hypothetical protein [Chloroflexota bacterium]MDA1272157.1 hypothetical protein [Chloroflexota bacterium]PKB58503.1 MAG: hypothetical protein BZY83_06660 [SAR202 cluster bacterium Casp-Chloro-G2]